MIISKNSQLGLRFEDNDVQVGFLELSKDILMGKLTNLNRTLVYMIDGKLKEDPESTFSEHEMELYNQLKDDVLKEDQELLEAKLKVEYDIIIKRKGAKLVNTLFKYESSYLDGKDSKYYLIQDSVYKASELIRIGENFSSRTYKDISFGKYTYLLGKNKMVRFMCQPGNIFGFYYDDSRHIALQFGLNIETGDFDIDQPQYAQEFSTVMRVMAFVELGDIEVITLEAGRNNGKTVKDGKITNTTNNTVFVVDSSWNKLIIRTDGFAVRGHFRLQPCGDGMLDRKLIWINAFEKLGYTRRPRAEIAR